MSMRRIQRGGAHIVGADYTDADELPFNVGGIFGAGLPFDLSEDESERVYGELVDREKRRRPAGFAPWPKELR